MKVDALVLQKMESKIEALGLRIRPGRSRQKEEEGESLYFYGVE